MPACADPSVTTPRPGGTSPIRARRPLHWAAALLAGLLLLSGCGVARVPPAPTRPPDPFPLGAPLAPPPTDCPVAPPIQTLTLTQLGNFSGSVRLYGAPPVWIPSEYFPHSTLHLDRSGFSGVDPYPGTKILWELGPDATPDVVARATDLRTGALGWWGNGNTNPYTPAFSVQGGRDNGEVDTGWHEWDSDLFIPAAGCYALDVSWPGGSWRTIFAAGR